MDSIYFYYNGRKSSDLGIYLVSVENGLKSTPFLADKQIISEKIAGNDIPYIYGVERNPLQFNLTLSCLEGKWTFEKRRELARWLDVDTFEEFYSTDNIDKRLYLQYQGGIDLTHNGCEEGYIQVDMVNISPYAYSPFQEKLFDLSDISSPTVIDIMNNGDSSCYPEIWIKKIDDGDIEIKNLSNSGKLFKFESLVNDETVYVDNQHRHIETDLPLVYRHDNFNNEYLELVRGNNRLEVNGSCQIKFMYQYIIKG